MPEFSTQTTAIKTREATGADASALVEVQYQAVHVTAQKDYDKLVLDAWATGSAEQIELIRANLTDKSISNFVLAAMIGGVIVGYGEIVPNKNELVALYVAPAAGLRGVGTRLLYSLESIARVLGASSLTIDASLTAMSFFSKHGYQKEGKCYHRLPDGTLMLCCKMYKQLRFVF